MVNVRFGCFQSVLRLQIYQFTNELKKPNNLIFRMQSRRQPNLVKKNDKAKLKEIRVTHR